MPFRLQVDQAKKKCLTTFGHESGHTFGLYLSPSETRIATAHIVGSYPEYDTIIQVFDLATKSCVGSLDIEKAAEETRRLLGWKDRFRLDELRFHGEDQIAFRSSDTFFLWNLERQDDEKCKLLISYSACPYTYVKDILNVGEDEVIYVTVYLKRGEGDQCEVRSVSTQEPVSSSQSSTLLLSLPTTTEKFQLFQTLGGKKWVAVWVKNERNTKSQDFFLYNLATLERARLQWKNGLLGGDFAYCPKSQTECTLCFLGWDNMMDVFSLNECSGKLSFSRSFQVHCDKYFSGTTSIVALTRSHVVVEEEYGSSSYVKAFSLNPRSFEKKYSEMIAIPEHHFEKGNQGRFTGAVTSLVRNELYMRVRCGKIAVFLCDEPTDIL